MLVYNQVYDISHTMFRALQIKEMIVDALEIDRYRILDFYLSFPAELLEIRSFQGFRKYETMVKLRKNRYEYIFDRKRTFYKMEQIQLAALRSLVAYGLLDATEFKNGRVARTDIDLPTSLKAGIDRANSENSALLDLITGPLASMNLFGHLGLKARTNLIEFKYDAV